MAGNCFDCWKLEKRVAELEARITKLEGTPAPIELLTFGTRAPTPAEPEVSTCDVPGCEIAGCHNPPAEPELTPGKVVYAPPDATPRECRDCGRLIVNCICVGDAPRATPPKEDHKP